LGPHPRYLTPVFEPRGDDRSGTVDFLDIGKQTRQTYSGGENAHEKAADDYGDWCRSGSRGMF
jgi:hypothetical protein